MPSLDFRMLWSTFYRNASLRGKRASGSIADDAPHNALRAECITTAENRIMGSLPQLRIAAKEKVAQLWRELANTRQASIDRQYSFIYSSM